MKSARHPNSKHPYHKEVSRLIHLKLSSMAMGETWVDELNNPSDRDVSILDQDQDLEPFLLVSDDDHYFTGADHDHMPQTLEAGKCSLVHT